MRHGSPSVSDAAVVRVGDCFQGSSQKSTRRYGSVSWSLQNTRCTNVNGSLFVNFKTHNFCCGGSH